MSRRGGGSKLLVGILCFLLGIIVAFGSIAGAVCAGLFVDFDTIFDWANVENKDEDGEYVYINTGDDGVKNAYALIARLMDYGKDPESLTIGQIEELIPAVSGVVDQAVDMAEDYVDMDREQLRNDMLAAKIVNLGEYVSSLVDSVKVEAVLNAFSPDMLGDDAAGMIIKAVVLGKEADYVTDDGGAKLPVSYDVYKYENDGYVRYTADENGGYTVNEGTALNEAFADLLVPVYAETEGDGASVPDYYKLCFYVYPEGGETAYVTDASFSFAADEEHLYTSYSRSTASFSGRYYVDNSGARVIVDPVTLGDLSSSDSIADSLDYVQLTDLIDSASDDDIVKDLLDGYSVGDLVSGRMDFTETINGIELARFVDVEPSNTAMVALLYEGVSGVTETESGWTALYTDDEGTVHDCTIAVENGVISSITYVSGDGYEKVKGTTVADVPELVDGLELTSIMDAPGPDDALMMYLLYGVTSVREDDGAWTAEYPVGGETRICTVEVSDGGTVRGVYYYIDGDVKVSTATTINGVSDVVDGIQNELEIGALIGGASVDDAIMVYLTYGVSGVYASGDGVYRGVYKERTAEGSVVEHAVTLELDGDGNVTGVRREEDGAYIKGTTVNGISDVISGLQDDLTIGELIDVDPSNKVLNAISGSTITGLSDRVNTLSVQEIYADAIYKTVNDEAVWYKAVADEDSVTDAMTDIAFDSDLLYYVLADDGYVLANGNGKLQSFDDSVTYYTHGYAVGAWKFMLYGEYGETIYTVNEVNELMTNTTDNIGSATLWELYDAGMLTSSYDTLAKEVGEGVTLGDLTIDGLLDYVANPTGGN